MLIESGASIFTRDKQGKNALDYALEVNETTIQDEQVFDQVLSGMLKEESESNALKQLHNLLRKYNKLHLKKSIICLLNRIPTLKARKGEFGSVEAHALVRILMLSFSSVANTEVNNILLRYEFHLIQLLKVSPISHILSRKCCFSLSSYK